MKRSSDYGVSVGELRAHPPTDVTLPCCFFFVEGTENLEFAWKREDIKEEYEVEDDKESYQFFRYYDFFEVFSQLVYQFSNNTEQLEEQSSLYEGRVSVDLEEISEGTLSLLLRNVDFMDEAIYKCSAITPNGRGQSTNKQIVEERDLSNRSTVEVLEEQMHGFYRVFSVLKYPVKLNEKYVCHPTKTDVNNQPFRIIRKYPSKFKQDVFPHKEAIIQ
ncbi:TPA: hypothetical protein BOS_880 [Bos taurus]|nr:TPA: hypothetical protein BOS_880 [Bos taurus]